LNVTGSTSTKTGVAPSLLTHPAVAKNEYVGVMTSSPAPMPSAIRARSSASVPEDTVTACPAPMDAASSCSNALDLGPEDEALAVADTRDGGEQLVANGRVLRAEVEQGH
jgi:hypothetical protein